MSQYEFRPLNPESIMFELKVQMTMSEWREVRASLTVANAYGPAYRLMSAIRDMSSQANKEFHAWPDDEAKEP